MSRLDRKLVRDLSAMRGQVLTIALLVAAGVAVFVGSMSTYDSLRVGAEAFYATARMPQVFVALKRAPLSILPRLNAISGVAAVEPRIAREVIVDWPSASLPVSAHMVSLSQGGDESLSRLHLRRGTAPEPGSGIQPQTVFYYKVMAAWTAAARRRKRRAGAPAARRAGLKNAKTLEFSAISVAGRRILRVY